MGREFNRLSVKQYGIMMYSLTLSSLENWMTYFVFKGHLLTAICVHAEFRSGDHTMMFKYV